MSTSGQRIGLFRATMLVAGNMIGSGVFLMPASMAPNGGISLLGWVVAVPCALLLAVVFARLATRRPMAGGPYAWARQFRFQTPTPEIRTCSAVTQQSTRTVPR